MLNLNIKFPHKAASFAVAIAAVIMLAVTSPGAVADTLFKCTGANGRVHYQDHSCAHSDTEVSRTPLKYAQDSEKQKYPSWAVPPSAVVNVLADPFNAYRLQGDIDGGSFSMLVDTGATYVAVSPRVAAALRLACESRITTSTANGNVEVCTSRVRCIKLGGIVLTAVPVIVVPGLTAADVLLGQTALSRLKLEQSKGELRLSSLE